MIDCLCRGFPGRGRNYWAQALTRLSQRPAVADFPRYGLALEKSGQIVGVVLTLYSLHRGQEGDEIRCNLSSWSVDTAFRPYASKLIAVLLRQKGVTFTNISPEPATLKANVAIGFRLSSNAQFAFLPALNPVQRSCRVLEVRSDLAELALLSDGERYTLSEHAALGCLSLLCICDGAAFPFVVVTRRTGHGLIRCGQIVYCRSLADLSRCAGTIGRYLLRRGILLCLVDAKEPIPGLFGRYFPNRGPRYFKGPKPPPLGDLTFTELVIFGP